MSPVKNQTGIACPLKFTWMPNSTIKGDPASKFYFRVLDYKHRYVCAIVFIRCFSRQWLEHNIVYFKHPQHSLFPDTLFDFLRHACLCIGCWIPHHNTWLNDLRKIIFLEKYKYSVHCSWFFEISIGIQRHNLRASFSICNGMKCISCFWYYHSAYQCLFKKVNYLGFKKSTTWVFPSKNFQNHVIMV